jgi:cation transporter-like permease
MSTIETILIASILFLISYFVGSVLGSISSMKIKIAELEEKIEEA